MERNFLERFKVNLAFPEKWFCIRSSNYRFLSLASIFVTSNIEFRLLADSKISVWITPIWKETFWKISRSASFCLKTGFVFVDQIWHYKAMYYYSIIKKIRSRRLKDPKKSLQETPSWEKSFWKVSRFALLFQKNGFVCVIKLSHYKALNQSSMTQKFRFKILTDFKKKRIENPNIERTFLERFKVCFAFPKNGFVFSDEIWHYKAGNQYSITQKI